MRSSQGILRAAVLILAVLSIPIDPDRSGIPFGPFWGLDFHNLWVFHHCELRNAPYASREGGTICHDVERRAMKYPPLLYWSFAWTRFFEFEIALRIWAGFIVVSLLAALLVWSERRIADVAFALLLLLHFPSLFALERGNNDVFVVFLWSLSLVALQRGEPFWSGLIAGIAVAAKVYPILAVATVAVAMRERMRFLLGVIAAGLLSLTAFPRDTLQYLDVLRAFAAERPEGFVFAHGLPTFFPPAITVLLAMSMLVTWGVSARRLFARNDAPLAFAGALAIATFFARTSYDYNLITAYPLMVTLFSRIGRARNPLYYAAAATALLLTIAGRRIPFAAMPSLLVLLETMSLCLAAVVCSWYEEPQREPAVERER